MKIAMSDACAEAPAGLSDTASGPVNEVGGISGPEGWKLRRTHGPTGLLAPTHYEHVVEHLGLLVRTNARRRRKGRHPRVKALHPQMTLSHKRGRGLCAPFGYRLWGWQPGNISWWVAQLFTWGSVWWIINGVFSVWPLENETVNKYIVGYFALAGGSFFLVGAYLAVVEVLNAKRKLEFGHEVKADLGKMEVTVFHHGAKVPADVHHTSAALEEGRMGQPSKEMDYHTHGVNGEHTGPAFDGIDGVVDYGSKKSKHFVGGPQPRWRWFGWEPRNFSYWTVIFQFIGATIFAVPACITGVPNVLPTDYESNYLLWDLLYWLPQVIASTFFMLSSYLQLVEVSGSWFSFKPLNIGWESGFWNLIGAAGFWLSGFFGFYEYPSGRYQFEGTAISTFWGSIAFLISSYLLIPEVLNP